MQRHSDSTAMVAAWQYVRRALASAAVVIALVYSTRVSYLFFHSLVELFSILTGFLVGVVAWYTHRFSRNRFMTFLGLAYLWVAAIDLLHTLAYKGMGVFPNADANLPTQLWLAARLLEAGVLVVAPRFLSRPLPDVGRIVLVVGGLALLLVIAIFSGFFPTAYVEGVGLTGFKIATEYVVIGLLFIAGVRLWKRRQLLDRNIVWLVGGAWGLTVIAELAFTFYIGVYDLSNLVGHLCKLGSFWLVFLALVQTSLTEPFRTLSRDSTTYDAIPEEILVIDRDGKVRQVNRVVRERLGAEADSVLGQDCHALFHPPTLKRSECPVCGAIERGDVLSGVELEMTDRFLLVSLSPIRDPYKARGMVHVSRDITLQKQAERQLQKVNLDFLARLTMLTDEGEAIAAIKQLFDVLMSPRRLYCVRFEGGGARFDETVPEGVRQQITGLSGDWAWSESGSGLILRINFAGETLAVLAVEDFAFPAMRSRYLNQALAVARVCGLAIQNARNYQRMREAEDALRMSERSLKLAQSLAHLGHWEWDVDSEKLSWSEETYRILGYAPYSVQPNRENFFHAIHPDDRALVEGQIRRARRGERFDIEYRIVPESGGVRVVRGMGEVVELGPERKPWLIGTLREIAPPHQIEVLGVIQDITKRKELEWKLEEEARTDSLTGCTNRRYFLQLAAREFTRTRRYGGALSVFMLDLDHFKAVNDRYGHQAGDVTLQSLVHLCQHTLREEDVVGRVGGEEFAVLLPETGPERALEVAERLRAEIADTPVRLADGTSLHITASIGVATLEALDTSVEMILGRADRALYDAKGQGRNKVVAHKGAAGKR